MKKTTDIMFSKWQHRTLSPSEIASFHITELNETNKDVRHWFHFKLNDIKYFMMLAQDPEDNNSYEIISVDHDEENCHFCREYLHAFEMCETLSEHSEELFKEILQHSKNRLRWLTKTVHF